MVKDVLQGWLLNCPFDTITLEKYRFTQERNSNIIPEYFYDRELFDIGFPYTRKVLLSVLDKTTHEYQLWLNFVHYIRGRNLDYLLLVNDRYIVNNPIVTNYNKITLQAYIYHFQEEQIQCLYI